MYPAAPSAMPRRCSSTIVTMTTRDVGECRVALQSGEHGPAVDIGHHDVEGDRRGPQRPRQLQPVDAVRRGLDGKAAFDEVRRDQLARRRVIVDHQDGAAGAVPCRDGGTWRARRGGEDGLGLGRQADGEGRPLARYARHPDIAAHQPAQPAADREPEPGPAELPRRRRVGLGEFLEQPAELFLGHADAGVGDGEIDPVLTGLFRARNTQPHRAALGEFAGIA
jgi:hypothetical protein